MMRTMRRAVRLVPLLFAAAAPGRVNGGRPPAPVAVAFASFAPLNTDLFVADADGGAPRPLLPDPALDYDAAFSPDGRWIVFTSERAGSADLFRVRPDGSGLERLTDDPAFDDQGVLSPDGRALAFVSSRSGQADVWVLDLTARRLRNLTNHPGGDFRPAWSPDGQWIAFSSDRDSGKRHQGFVTLHSTEVYLVRRDGSGLRRLTHRGAFAGSPSWSPDGSRLAIYEADPDEVQKITSPRRLRGTTQIATVDVATGERRVLTAGAGEKSSPRWLRDGRIAYVSGGPEGGIELVTDGVATVTAGAYAAGTHLKYPHECAVQVGTPSRVRAGHACCVVIYWRLRGHPD
jgi:TolB protein